MYLKSITVKGFKSFPERTRLEFGPGVSVIVGPNGSGKSNVTDAVLWALGEQSPGNVRGQSMQDVIFAGAPGRQAAGHAEVELVLDDSEGALSLGTSELSIYRRLDRTGEGEYRLAGARCRLVDVVELLSDTGLGKEMHSVISQGRVESIVTSKPRERRLLIEEAAGLGKHRKRRRRAQLKLTRTQDNLDRALDVEREARSRLRPLKRQAEAAELHARLERQALEIRWQLARDDVRAHRETLAQDQRAAAEVRGRRAALERELEEVAKRREAAEEALAMRSAAREELSRRSYAARAAAERVSYRTEAAGSASATVRARVVRACQAVDALRHEAEQDQPDTEAETRIAALQDGLAALDRDREQELARQLEGLERRRDEADQTQAGRAELVLNAAAEREQAEARVEQARAAVREAEKAVEAARREAAQVGAELAAVNQFLRHQAASPSGVPALADELEVDAGYELALSAALDGRLRAAVVAHREAGSELLDRSGAEGGRALVAGGTETGGEVGAASLPAEAEPLADHIRGANPSLTLARALLRDTWVVEDLGSVGESFGGVAVTRSGRVWSAHTRELRQAPAVGEDRVLAERNRREQLVAASEVSAQAEHAARSALE
jgi:chromosome segregation protein